MLSGSQVSSVGFDVDLPANTEHVTTGPLIPPESDMSNLVSVDLEPEMPYDVCGTSLYWDQADSYPDSTDLAPCKVPQDVEDESSYDVQM